MASGVAVGDSDGALLAVVGGGEEVGCGVAVARGTAVAVAGGNGVGVGVTAVSTAVVQATNKSTQPNQIKCRFIRVSITKANVPASFLIHPHPPAMLQ